MSAMNRPHAALRSQDPTDKVTCESALREAGVDEVLVARKLKDLLEAKRRRWNPKKKAFDMFDDYETQLAAAIQIVKIFGGYPSESEDNQAPVMINISALPMRREPVRDGSERREHCEADTTVSAIGSDGVGNRRTSKPYPGSGSS